MAIILRVQFRRQKLLLVLSARSSSPLHVPLPAQLEAMSEGWAFPQFPYIAVFGPDGPPGIQVDPSHGATRPGGSDGDDPMGEDTSIPSGAGANPDEDMVDPRNVPRGRQTCSHKTAEQNLVHKLLRRFLQGKELLPQPRSKRSRDELNSLPTMPPTVDPAILKKYRQREHPGPTTDYMPIAFNVTMEDPWNQRVIQLLVSEFKAKVEACIYQELTVLPEALDINFLINATQDKLANHQTQLRATLREITAAAQSSPGELHQLMNAKNEQTATRMRRRERKKNLYVRRGEILLHQVEFSEDPRLWKGIRAVFAFFDDKDMSSDETETEPTFTTRKETRRVRKHWISDDISKIMHYIDRHYQFRTTSGTLKRGNVPLKRHLEARAVNDVCDPKPELPRNFYSSNLKPMALNSLRPSNSAVLPRVPLDHD